MRDRPRLPDALRSRTQLGASADSDGSFSIAHRLVEGIALRDDGYFQALGGIAPFLLDNDCVNRRPGLSRRDRMG